MTEIKEHHSEPEVENSKIEGAINVSLDYEVDLKNVQRKFFELEAMFQKNMYLDTLTAVEEAISSGKDEAKKVQGIGLSYALLSSQKLLESLKYAHVPDMEVGILRADELLVSAKKDYFYENYKNANKSLIEFKVLTFRLSDKQKVKIAEHIKKSELELEEVRRFGANTKVAARKLKEAKKFLSQDLVVPSTEALISARELVKEAEVERSQVISQTISFVEKMISDAQAIGAGTADPEKELNKAKSLFLEKRYQMCMYATIKAEELAADIIQKQAEQARKLEDSLMARFREVAAKEPYQKMELVEESEVKEKPSVQKMCPTCQNPIEYYDRYRKWYCAFCMKYL
jgi:hypothetical protein